MEGTVASHKVGDKFEGFSGIKKVGSDEPAQSVSHKEGEVLVVYFWSLATQKQGVQQISYLNEIVDINGQPPEDDAEFPIPKTEDEKQDAFWNKGPAGDEPMSEDL